jgi:hypothetical protein
MDPTQPATQQPPQTPPEVSVPQPKPNYLKKVIFSVLIVLLVSSIIYLYIQNQKLQKQIINQVISPTIQAPLQTTQTVSPTPKTVISIKTPPDLTTDWKMYTNTKLGYKLKYPRNWILVEPCVENCQGPIPLSIKSPIFIHPDGQLIIDVQDLTCQGLNNQSWSKPVNKTTINIDGQAGLLITGKFDYNDNQLHDVKNICIPFNGKGYYFSMWSLNNQGDIKIFDQIISTFKFVSTKDTATIIGINLTNCCPCPKYINKSQVEKDGWIIYENGKDYTNLLPKECANVSCEPCQLL